MVTKSVKVLVIIILASVFLLSFPFLYVFIHGAILGSFEEHLTRERIEQARPVYIFASVLIVFVDVVIATVLAKMIKSIRRK